MKAPLRRFRSITFIAGAMLLLSDCSQRTTTSETPAKNTPAGAGFMNNPLLPGANNPNAINMSVTSEADLRKVEGSTDEDDIIWTDPDNPDAENAELDAAFENRRQGNGWLTDYGQALKLSRRQGKPLIIWFHDSVTSPKSKTLGKDLLETDSFDAQCKDRTIRFKLDSGVAIDETGRRNSRYSLSAINRLARKYGIDRRPGVVVICPHSGKVTARINGMDGFVHDIHQELLTGIQTAEASYEAHKKKLIAQGFRTWTERTGKSTLFAKLMRFDEKNNFVYLKDPGGKISKTRLERFSKADIAYLDEHARKKSTR